MRSCWNSEKYKSANHIKALDIRQSAMRSLELYHDRIARHISKRSLLPSDRDVKSSLPSCSASAVRIAPTNPSAA